MQMTFGEAMLSLIKQRGLSATAVAEDLGFKNRTAFFRILHDESRMPGVEKCFEAAKASSLLALTEEEIRELMVAMNVSELGRQAYGMSCVLRRMIYPIRQEDHKAELIIEGMTGVRTLEDVLKHISAYGKIDIMLLGRCRKRVLDRLHRLTQEIRIDRIFHMIAIDEEDSEDIKVFAEMSDILFSSVYSVHYLNETNKSVKNWWLRSGVILFIFEDEHGLQRMIQLAWLGGDRYLISEDESGSMLGFWKNLIESIWQDMAPLKKEMDVSSAVPDMQHYIEFTDEFRKLENNRAIYMIKPDFPINCVPPELIAPMITESLNALFGECDIDQMDQIGRLYEIHKSRMNNLYEKKKPTHIVLNAQAMMRFARTGQRSDHFFLCRPYTSEERVQVLTLLCDQTRNNPNFNIWFSRDSDIIDDKEVTIYDGHGVAMIKADTSWHLENDHQEIMLESRMMTQHFKSYFMSSILGKSVMSKEETISLLNEMIDAAKHA